MEEKDRSAILFSWILFICIVFAGCSTTQLPAEGVSSQSDVSATVTGDLSASDQQEPIEANAVSQALLPQDPQEVIFPAGDGTTLNGIFYPAGTPSAPLVILMHWAPGDQQDWTAIAPWLQNRGWESVPPEDISSPWLDASWFPKITEGFSLNVFTFTFRNCAEGCRSFERENWYEDVQGAVDFAVGLEGVDSSRVIMIGASIGADGAVDGCAYLNEKSPGSCLGALSLSPGNYLTIDYADKVIELDPVPIYCLYAEVDPESFFVCDPIDQPNFQGYPYPADMVYSNGHGMNLIQGDYDPNPLDLIVQFINEVFKE